MSRRETLRGRGMKPGASYWCEHDYPMLANPTGTGSYYARCLRCLAIGPERASSEAARQALLMMGARGEDTHHRVASSRTKEGCP
jgi:hypothetical protein